MNLEQKGSWEMSKQLELIDNLSELVSHQKEVIRLLKETNQKRAEIIEILEAQLNENL